MAIDASNSELQEIQIDRIDRNPENPRILFRQEELEQLLESIRTYGVQVPISVYKERNRFVLIDGERRWRCSLKLNKKTIPALIQEKPDPLTNLVLMFNIHSLREQWDLLTIAMKLPRVIALLEADKGSKPNERLLSQTTGLSRGVIRRCRLLMDLPQEYKDLVLDELKKPKSKQRVTEDLFIEMERALTTVERAMPEIIDDRDRVRRVLLQKYKAETINNVTQFRQIAKIARIERVAEVRADDRREAQDALVRLFKPNKYSIVEAYEDSVSYAYSERDIVTRINALLMRLEELAPSEIDELVRDALRQLIDKAQRLLEGNQ
jgi:ParB family chromosome partitioning protein